MIHWRTDIPRALAILAASSLLGLGANALSPHPVPLMASDGPGALPEREERISLSEYLREENSAAPPLLLDVRSKTAYDAGHVPSAVSFPLHLPHDEFVKNLSRLSALVAGAPEIVVMCDSERCPLADRMAKLLKQMQYQHVRVLGGGWQTYKERKEEREKRKEQ